MADSEKQSFWTTLPGVLTGVAALLTAVTGLLVVMHPRSPSVAKGSTVTASGSQGAKTEAAGGAGPAASSPTAQVKKATVVVVETDGTETRLSLKSFKDSYSDQVLQLKSGQSISFDRVQSIDFLEVHAYEQDLRLTLTDGRTLEGAIMVGEAIVGETDVGAFSVPVTKLKRIVFERP